MTSLRQFIVLQSSLPAGSTVRNHINNPAIGGGVAGITTITNKLNAIVKTNKVHLNTEVYSSDLSTRIVSSKLNNKIISNLTTKVIST